MIIPDLQFCKIMELDRKASLSVGFLNTSTWKADVRLVEVFLKKQTAPCTHTVFRTQRELRPQGMRQLPVQAGGIP